MSSPEGASLAHLYGRLRALEARVRAAVEARRASDPNPDDPFRGLYLADGDVDRLLSGPGPPLPGAAEADALAEAADALAEAAASGGEPVRLRRMEASFGLGQLDVELLMVALAPDLDVRFERLYGYLHDDVSRRRASIGLALELAGRAVGDPTGRSRLLAGAPLIDGGLVLVEDDARPFLSRTIRVPDRVTMFLLGDDRPHPALTGVMAPPVPLPHRHAPALARAMDDGASLCYLRERPGGLARGLAASALALRGKAALVIDLRHSGAAEDHGALARAAALEAGLQGAGIVVGPIEAIGDGRDGWVRSFAELPCDVVVTGTRSWDPAWSSRVPLILDVAAPDPEQRAGMWRASLNGDGSGLDAAAATAQFRLGPEQVIRAATAARLQAGLAGRAMEPADLRAGARAQNAAGLERLSRRLEPAVGWDDLVLPHEPMSLLRELAARTRQRENVLDRWGMRRGGAQGEGITALFAGGSGTGKTMAAEVLAGDLGLDLYTIELATVVDKYIGETEKNLERIFTEAEGVNAVLFFDEADALFGKRSDVKDARDRYANIEVAYLLQRMESFDGVAILATNLRANIDEAFARRLDAVIDFPQPDEEHRLRLWERCLPPGVPRGDDLDLGFCAGAFELSGGNIRNIALTAAYLASEGGRSVTMADLIRGVEREYRKLGRLCVESEFGRYFEFVSS